MVEAEQTSNAPLLSSSPDQLLPDIEQSIKLNYAKLGFHYLISHGIYLFLWLFVVVLIIQLPTISLEELHELWDHLRLNLISVILGSTLIVFLFMIYILMRPRPVYLVNFACYKPKKARQMFIDLSKLPCFSSQENLQFQRKIIERSGLGESTYLPDIVVNSPSYNNMTEARKEARAVMFEAIDELLAKTKVKPDDIGILIVNCGLFTPIPSPSAMVVNHFKLRINIVSHNLSGMGCSASIISIDLAKDLLQVYPNSYALVVSIENIAMIGRYAGNNRSMLVTNCLFRVGGAAILLSNRRSERRRSKYQLMHVVRTHTGADDRGFDCVTHGEDEEGHIGISLSKDLMAVAADSLKANITTLAPLILPMSEQLISLATWFAKKVFNMKVNPYVPDFKLAIEHFCIHTGGRAVIDELGKNLRLSDWHMEPTRMTLYRFGNTSSSSLWYGLAYTEAKGRMKKKDRLWQIALGGGFKCNCAVWKALKTVNPANEKNPWNDEIDNFPVEITQVQTRSKFAIRLIKFD